MSQITSPIILDTTGQDIVDAIESLSNRANDIENFTSSDVADGSATAWTSVTPLASGEVHSSIFAKISQMFKNIRYLYKMLGTTNISSIGGGTVTGAISALNSNQSWVKVYEGSITAGDSAVTLSKTGKIYGIRFSNAEDSTATNAFVFVPYVGGSQVFYVPVMYGGTNTYARLSISSSQFAVLAVGNENLYVKQIFAIL